MSLTTVEQVRRIFRIVSGFTLLAAGAVMVITPGPGWLVIFFGLGLLAAEFVWARRLMNRMKRESERAYNAVSAWRTERPGPTPQSQEPTKVDQVVP